MKEITPEELVEPASIVIDWGHDPELARSLMESLDEILTIRHFCLKEGKLHIDHENERQGIFTADHFIHGFVLGFKMSHGLTMIVPARDKLS